MKVFLILLFVFLSTGVSFWVTHPLLSEAFSASQPGISHIRFDDRILYTDVASLSGITLSFSLPENKILPNDIPKISGTCVRSQKIGHSLSGSILSYTFFIRSQSNNCLPKLIKISLGEKQYYEKIESRTQSGYIASLLSLYPLPYLSQRETLQRKLLLSQRALERLAYERQQQENLEELRSTVRYTTPVLGYKVPVFKKHIPGANRPYRKDTTDGIHHGWDIFAPAGTPVHALASGVIIRVVDNFSKNSFQALQTGENLTPLQKAKNLDVFRGNQVWLQTLDGNVVFYSHLKAVSENLEIGKWVVPGEYLGTIGVTGVPYDDYEDYHLHFEIQMRPKESLRPPSFEDILLWPYFGKGQQSSWILENQKKLFFEDAIISSQQVLK